MTASQKENCCQVGHLVGNTSRRNGQSAHNISRTLLLTLALAAVPVSAFGNAPPRWGEPYNYLIVDQDLRGVLAAFGANLGIRVQLSDEIRGQVHGKLPEQPAGEFLNSLARRFGFDWYFDGGALYITEASEAQARMLVLGSVAFSDLSSELARLGVLDDRYPLRHSSESNLALVSGPPRYVALIEETLTVLSQQVSADVVVFRGRRGEGQ